MNSSAGGYKNVFFNLICPALVFGGITGSVTAAVVMIYKLCAGYVISFSEKGYGFLKSNPVIIIPVIAALFAVAVLFGRIYKSNPNLKGGGIPTSIGILRGIFHFKWIRNLFGVFAMSMTSFLIGVPLGNEGPSVQMGTAVGKGCVRCARASKKHAAWERYSMTGGACAGFATATGAPLSGIMFAVEEAHQRISPTIIITASVSVMFANITTELLAPVFGVGTSLFPKQSIMKLSAGDIWLPLLIGVCLGLFAVIFLKYYKLISTLVNKKLCNFPVYLKIFFVFLLTLAAGLVSFSFISTGHELILSLFENNFEILILAAILVVRATVTLAANTAGVTGGIFLPIMALGALLSTIVAKLLILCGLGTEYYTIILVLGITACISGMMKMPLTAVLFATEALSCHENIMYVIIVSTVAFAITEIFKVKSINDSVIDSRIKIRLQRPTKVFDTFVTVKNGSFAVGKQIRDILWPYNLFVLSLQRKSASDAVVDEHGEKCLRAGDILHVRYSTYDEKSTKEELIAIVGVQTYEENETDIV